MIAERNVVSMLNFRELMTPYKYYDGSFMIVFVEKIDSKYRLSDSSHTLRYMMKSFQVDYDSIKKAINICQSHGARIKNTEIIMNVNEDSLYIELDRYCCMLLEIEKAFRSQNKRIDSKDDLNRDESSKTCSVL